MSLDFFDVPFQWQIMRVNFDPIQGSEQAGVRPAIIVSSDAINAVLEIVSVVPLTTRKTKRRAYSTEAILPAGTGGLPQESVAMAHQIRTVSRARLLGSYGTITDEVTRENVRQALRIHLDLD